MNPMQYDRQTLVNPKRTKPVIETQCVIRAEESAEEASELDADNLRIEGEWVWYHGCRRVGARRT